MNKKIIFSILSLIILFISCKRELVDAAQGVMLTENNFPTVSTKAKTEKKPIFLYIWWTECSACADTKAKVLVDKELSTYLNEKFVNASQEYHASGAAEVLKKYPAPVTPYFFILNPDGSVAQSFRGYQKPAVLLKAAKAVGGN